MAYKSTGTAGKSASGASMSKYDVEVEARLQALEAVVHEHSEGTSDTTLDGDSPIIIRTTSPTVAVPTDSPDSNLTIIDKER